MNNLFYDDLDNLIDEITTQVEFQRLLELKGIINDKYKPLINQFNVVKDEYQNALPMKKYYKDFDKLQARLSSIKEELYLKPEVLEYHRIEKFIERQIDEITNDMAKAISNKFEQKRIIG